MTFPLGTLYHGTKFAVEGLSEALHYDMEAIGVNVKIVEPGFVQPDFGGRSFDFSNDETMTAYQSVVGGLMKAWAGDDRERSEPELVAGVIYQAAADGTDQLRYPAGADAVELVANRKAADDATFIGGVKAQFGLAGTPAKSSSTIRAR